MKVLHVIPSLGPLRGGPSFALPLLARAQARAGLEVEIATTNDNGPASQLSVAVGRPQIADGVTTWYFPRQTRFYCASLQLARWLTSNVNRFDIVHIHALFSFAALPAAAFAKLRGVPYIIRPLGTLSRWSMERRRPLLKRLSFRLLESRLLGGAVAVHYTSEQERDEAAILDIRTPAIIVPLGLEPEEFERLPPASDFFAEWPSLVGRPIVLFMSRIDPKKGLDILLPAFACVHSAFPEAVLVIAGDGQPSYVAEMRHGADKLGLGQSTVWPGLLIGPAKLAALSAATAFVLPSHSENFGLAPVEAMAAGKPVIISNRVGIWPEVLEFTAGLVVPPDIAALSDALIRMLGDQDFSSDLSRNGRRLVRERFSSQATAQRLISAYEQVTGLANAPRRYPSPILARGPGEDVDT